MKGTGMKIIRVKPRTFEEDWRDDFRRNGIKVPEEILSQAYTPINHKVMTFSVEVDLERKQVMKRIVGVIPNATYQGHIYTWDEFCWMMEGEK